MGKRFGRVPWRSRNPSLGQFKPSFPSELSMRNVRRQQNAFKSNISTNQDILIFELKLEVTFITFRAEFESCSEVWLRAGCTLN